MPLTTHMVVEMVVDMVLVVGKITDLRLRHLGDRKRLVTKLGAVSLQLSSS
jgi:hypothetical protein